MEKKQMLTKMQAEVLSTLSHVGPEVPPSLKKGLARIFFFLNRELQEQTRRLEDLENRVEKSEDDFRFLIKKLVEAGYINGTERRKLMNRSILTQEALLALLDKKKIIPHDDLVGEIRKIGRPPKRNDSRRKLSRHQ